MRIIFIGKLKFLKVDKKKEFGFYELKLFYYIGNVLFLVLFNYN